jgi:hypothetical protein
VPLPWVVVSRPWRAGSVIRDGGDGGLAIRAITAVTAVAVPAVIATSMTAIVVLLVILVPGVHCCRYCHRWVGEMAWRMVVWLSGAQRWCRAPLGQLKDLYYPCGSPLVASHSEL